MADLSKLLAPASVVQGLESLTRQLADAAGPNLRSVLLFGGLAAGRYREGRSDLNVAIVLDDASGDALSRIAAVLQQAHRTLRVEPLLLSAAEVQQAADVFPTKFLQMQRQHVVLHGINPFDGLTISREHVRLRVEQELRNLVLRLRRRLVTAHEDPVALATVLHGVPVALAVNLAALADLAGTPVADGEPIETAKAAALALGLEAGALEPLRSLRGPGHAPKGLVELTGRILALVAAAAERADSLEVTA
jgi:hypothetical protein